MHHAITLEALRVLDAIDRRGSFLAAADALFKVPSALTYTVQKLESELGVSLFDRSRQRAQLTEAGRLVLERGRVLLQDAQDLEEAVKQLESGWETTIRIARDTVLPITLLLEQVHQFNQLGRHVSVQISEEVLGGGWDALVAGRCDLTLGASGEIPKGVFEYRVLGDMGFVFAVAPGHPLAQWGGPIDAQAISAFPTVIAADTSITTPARSSGLIASRQSIRVANMGAKIEAQRMGVGVGFLPRHMVTRLLATGELIELECTIPRPPMPLYMAWRKNQKGNALAWFVEACARIKWLG
ncbi:MAG: LysR family transcriptional regulator [Gammaproteobacteria bacterium]|nr:LysR family transcriptional regulator [Gammaproteobacteria bacterium]MDP2141828.1 LysR family transcriptional regulator [Gammaproteobacteria bacterium]MDP2348319.1 LysR family transcriptional regulator [Gammaproteobacteria bacterium]